MIRLARPGDEPHLKKLMQETGLTVDGARYDEWSPTVVVCELKGDIVGFVQAFLGKPLSAITSIAVHPAYQGRGIAKAMMAAMEFTMASQGIQGYGGTTATVNDKVRQNSFVVNDMRYVGDGAQYVRLLK